jgi:hypothetical protein
MVKIYTPYEDEKPKRVPNDPGNIMEPQYKERYDENGNAYLEQVGEINTYEKIQSYKDEVDPMSILARYAAGDTTVMANPGWYIDTSKLPENYIEWRNLMNEQKEKFETLPLEIRNRFGNNFDSWAATAGEPEWLEKMGIMPNQSAAAASQNTAEETKKEDKA